jgi:hypothetical protein
VELFADIVSALGIPKSIGQIYGLLYASATPLSFSDIVERLEISKGSVSQGLQLLRSLGAINVADFGEAKGQGRSAKSEGLRAKGQGRGAKSQGQSGKAGAGGRGRGPVDSGRSAVDGGRQTNSAPLALSSSPYASGPARLALGSLPSASGSAPLAPSPLPFASGSAPSASDASRREYFEPELSLRKLVAGVLRERVTPFATASTERLARLRELADQDTGTEKHYLDRVKQLESWRRRLKTVLPVLGALLGPIGRK